RGHDQHHDRRADGFAPGRPDDLRRFVAHLPDEFAWGCLRHCFARLRIEKRPAGQSGRRGWMRLSDTTLSLQGGWQEWRDSNPRPSVLETDALPTELHSCGRAATYAAVGDCARAVHSTMRRSVRTMKAADQPIRTKPINASRAPTSRHSSVIRAFTPPSVAQQQAEEQRAASLDATP